MDILDCLKKHGQRLDSEIAHETGIGLHAVRERLAALTLTGQVIACKVTRFQQGKRIESCLYRAAGFVPPPAVGRKPKPSR